MFHSSWTDHFPDTTPNSLVSSGSSRVVPNSGDLVHVYYCFFNDFSGSTNGGAIYFSTSSTNSKLLVESSSFTLCSSIEQGGAIYFSNSGSCIYYRVCGTSCSSSNSYGKFDCIYTPTSSSNPNFIMDSTFCSCTSDTSYAIVYHLYGTGLFSSINISDNICPYDSGFRYCLTTGVTSSMKFCTISQNQATSYRCLLFYNSGTMNVESTNIIHNIQPSNVNGGLIQSSINIYLKYCCIIDNDGSPTFHNAGSSSFIIDNCYIDESSMSKITGSVSFTNTASSLHIHFLSHLSSGSCHAQHYYTSSSNSTYPSCVSIPNHNYQNIFGGFIYLNIEILLISLSPYIITTK